MKKVTASEARKNWFRLLDEAAAGEVMVIERNGKRLLLKQEEPASNSVQRRAPQYGTLLKVREPEKADQWRWQWSESGQRLRLLTKPKK
ncbi:MAG: type II toxin-antitoxin system Phd/YefM family antitoxin [Acidobacteriota bacterium]